MKTPGLALAMVLKAYLAVRQQSATKHKIVKNFPGPNLRKKFETQINFNVCHIKLQEFVFKCPSETFRVNLFFSADIKDSNTFLK